MKAIFYTDLHKGGLKEPAISFDVRLHGQMAFDMNCAIFDYAEKNEINDVIHGGDESTFVSGDLAHHMRRATEIQSTMHYQGGDLHRVIGNHDPSSHLAELGFKTQSYKKNNPNSKNWITICQPTIGIQKGQTRYSYDPKAILKNLPSYGTRSNNIIIASHWAFDRMERGYPKVYDIKGYAYHDETNLLKTRLKGNARKNINRVLSLHGHEHRFSHTVNLGFNCLVMPSIVQANIDNYDQACGLFVEITDEKTPDKSLSWEFKQIINPRLETDRFGMSEVAYDVQPVDLDYMRQYERPVMLKP